EAYRRAIALQPQGLNIHYALRIALMAKGSVDDAVADWKRMIQDNPTNHEAWDGYAEYCLFLGRTDEYHAIRAELLNRFSDSVIGTICEATGRACLLLPTQSSADLARATAMIDRANAAYEKDRSERLRSCRFARSLAEYRAGHFGTAFSILKDDGEDALKSA